MSNSQIHQLQTSVRMLEQHQHKIERKLKVFFEMLDSLPFDAQGNVTLTREGIRDLEDKLLGIEYGEDKEEE